MFSVVILAFAFVTPAFTLPFTTQGQTTTGIEQTVGDYVKETFQNAESVIPSTSQVEKTGHQGVQNVYHQQQQQQQPQPVETVGEKTGVQSSPETYPQGVNTPVSNVEYHAGQQVYTQEKTSGADAVRPVSTYVEQVGAQNVPQVERRPESSLTPVSTYGEKTGTHGTPAEYSNVQQPVLLPVNPDAFPKQVEPVNVAVPVDPQQILPVPITPGIQALSGLPVPGNQIVNPIVVPTEGVTGRLIIMSIEPIQQRVFQPETPSTVGTVEKQVPQQVSQPVDYTPVQGHVEPSNQQYLSAQSYVPENVEKQAHQQQPVQVVNEAFTPVQQQVAEQTQQQLYNVQPQHHVNVDPVADKVEKQYAYPQETQASSYVPSQPQEVEPNQQQPLNVQQVVPQQPQIKTEQQLPYQQSQVQNTGYTPNIPYPSQKIQPVQQGIATHVPEHVPQNENPKQSLPNQPAQSVQPLQTFSCIPAQTLSAVPPHTQVQSVQPVSNTPN